MASSNQPRRTIWQRHEQRQANSTLGAPLQSPAVEVPMDNVPEHGLTIAVIPDTQVRPGVPTDHLRWCGKYLARQRPDVIVCIGDFADMPSLSSHDLPGSVPALGKNYRDDIDSVHRAMDAFMSPIHAAYDPTLILTLGNHEDRIDRAVSADPRKLEGVYSVADLGYEKYGWRVVPFLQPVTIGGVAFCHYFPSGVMGRAITTAPLMLKHLHQSAFAGHQQGRQIAYGKRADGREITAIISGSFYQHDEGYMSPYANRHWRGMYMLHEVRDGIFDEMAVSIGYLRRKFA